MAVSQSTCNVRVKCKIVTLSNESYFEHDLVMANHLSRGNQTERITSLLEEGKNISQIVTILVRRSKNLVHHCQKVGISMGNQPWTARSALLWMTQQDYFQNGCLYGSEGGRR